MRVHSGNKLVLGWEEHEKGGKVTWDQEGRFPAPPPGNAFLCTHKGPRPLVDRRAPSGPAPTLQVPGPTLKEFEVLVQSHRPKLLTAHVGRSGVDPSTDPICWPRTDPGGGDRLSDSPSPARDSSRVPASRSQPLWACLGFPSRNWVLGCALAPRLLLPHGRDPMTRGVQAGPGWPVHPPWEAA